MAFESKVITLEQVAEYLKVHPSTIYRLLKRKELPGFKVGRDWRFNIESIDKWRIAGEGQRTVEFDNGYHVERKDAATGS